MLPPDMTRVCLVGDADTQLRYELLSRETSREALQTYDLHAPYENTLGVETVSLGAAISLLNDLNWYLVRFVDEALVLEPSVSEDEWLSRDLARAIRDDEIQPEETGRLLKVYGIERPEPSGPPTGVTSDSGDVGDDGSASQAEESSAPDGEDAEAGDERLSRLVEPMYLTRTGDGIPTYDIRDVEDTLVVRVTEAEFEAG